MNSQSLRKRNKVTPLQVHRAGVLPLQVRRGGVPFKGKVFLLLALFSSLIIFSTNKNLFVNNLSSFDTADISTLGDSTNNVTDNNDNENQHSTRSDKSFDPTFGKDEKVIVNDDNSNGSMPTTSVISSMSYICTP